MRLIVITILGLAVSGLGGCDTLAIGTVATAAKITLPRDALNVRMRTLEYGRPAPLIPQPFSITQPRNKVEAVLARARYKRGTPTLSTPVTPDFADAEVWYRNDMRFPCDYGFYVFVRFDSADRLLSADGIQDGGDCL